MGPKPAAKKSPEKTPVPPVPPPPGQKGRGRPPGKEAAAPSAAKKDTPSKKGIDDTPALQEEEEKEDQSIELMPFLESLETKRLADNALLKKALRRSTSPVRTKVPPGYKAPPGAKAAVLRIQCAARQMLARRAMHKRKLLGKGAERRRKSLDGSIEDNPVYRQMGIRTRILPLKFQEEAQASALSLQAVLRSRQARGRYGSSLLGAELLGRRVRTQQDQVPWQIKYTKILLYAYMRRFRVRCELARLRIAGIVLQAYCRRRTLGEIRRSRHLWARDMFQQGYRAHKMTMIREIKVRKEGAVPLQAVFKMALQSREYAVVLQESRKEAYSLQRRGTAAMFLTARTRMTIYHRQLHLAAASINLLCLFARARADQDEYIERLEAAYLLRRHLKSVAAQMSVSLRLLMPLTRHTQAYRKAKRSAEVLQSYMRVWAMGFLGLKSSVEIFVQPPKVAGEELDDAQLDPSAEWVGRVHVQVGRVHLNMEQKRAAAIELQRGVRKALAFTGERSVQPSGYSAKINAVCKLQSSLRGRRIRDMLSSMSDMYGAVVIQAQARMRRVQDGHRLMVAAHIRTTAACKRALANRWFVETFKAQIVLQAVAKMRAAPDPGFFYSRLPTRKLASLLQARSRRTLVSREHADKIMAAICIEAIVKGKVYRMQFLSTKLWCQKAGGNAHDLHKLFGKLTVRMDKNGSPFWRKKDFVHRRDKRSVTYGGGPDSMSLGAMSLGSGTVTGLAMTERKRGLLNEARRVRNLQEQKESAEKAKQVGLILTELLIPTGTGRILVEGRLAKVISESTVMLDELGTSNVLDCYRHFFLKNGKEMRRIIKYTRDRICTVVPPFDRRPVEDSAYTIIDHEPAPFEPNLVQIRRQREFEAARCIQNRWRQKKAKKEFSILLMAHRWHLSALEAEEAYQGQLTSERERLRLKAEAEARARNAAMEEGKRLVAEAQAAHEARLAAMKEAKRKQLERLWGLKPNIPVAPARPFSPSYSGRASPRVGTFIQSVQSTSPPKVRPRPPSVEELEALAWRDLRESALAMPTADRVETFFARPGLVLPAIPRNTTMNIIMRSREPSPDRGMLPRIRPPSSGSDRDLEGRHAYAASPLHMRNSAKSGMERALIDRSPPKMDIETLNKIEELKFMRENGRIDMQEFRERARQVRTSWRDGLRSPASPGKSMRWNDSVRYESDSGTWDPSMVEVGWFQDRELVPGN